MLKKKGQVGLDWTGCTLLSVLLFMLSGAGNTLLGLNFRSVSTGSSLSQSSVLCMVQDSTGFLWVGTKDGLNRFDGYEYVSFKYDVEDESSLSNNEISCLVLQDSTYLWIGTRSGGINRLELATNKITRYRGLTYDDLIRDLYIDKEGHLWAGTSEGLLLYESGPENEPGQFKNISRNVIYRQHTNEPFNPIRKNVSVVSIFQHEPGKLILGAEEGLFEFDLAEASSFRSVSPITVDKTVFTKIYRDRKGQLWASSYDGLFRLAKRLNVNAYDVVTYGTRATGDLRLPVDWVEDFVEDWFGDLWLATRGGGLLRISDNKVQDVYSYMRGGTNSIPDNIINSLFIDRTGVLWIGTESHELVYLDLFAKQFSVLLPGQQNGLSDNLVTAITGNDHVLVVGTAAAGIDVFHQEKGRLSLLKNVPRVMLSDTSWKSEISALLLDEDSLLWIGSATNSLAVLDPDGNFESYVVDGFIFSLFEDHRDNIWFGTWGQGIGYINKYTRQLERYNETPEHMLGLGSDKVLSVFEDSRGLLWVGTKGGGLSVAPTEDIIQRKGSFKVFRHNPDAPKDSEGLAYNDVYDIREDAEGNIWLATGRGLNKVELSKDIAVKDVLSGEIRFQHISEKDGLPGGLVYTIRFDESGYLWLGTNKGLCRYHPTEGSLVSYGINDGLPSDKFNLNSAFVSENNQYMFFGGVDGLTIFHPSQIENNPFEARVAITDFKLHNRSVRAFQQRGGRRILDRNISHQDQINLAYSDNEISFEFSALHYSSPDKIRYAYRLLGFNDEWQETGSFNRRITYTNLRFGTYTLQLRATNNDGVWASELRELVIVIDPPWYLSPWAYALYFLIFLLLLIIFRKYSVIAVKKKNQLIIESLEHKKETEIAEAKMRFFTNVSHEIRTPLTLIHAPLQELINREDLDQQTHKVLSMILRNVRRLLNQVNQLLELRKMDKGELAVHYSVFSLETLVQELLLDFEPITRQNQVGVVLKAPIDSMIASDKRLLATVVHNLLSNSVKFSPVGHQVTVHIERKSENGKDEYVLRICDQGPGIPEGEEEKVFHRFYQLPNSGFEHLAGSGIGLSIVKDFVEKLQGKVCVYNQEEGGCCFEVVLPEGDLKIDPVYDHRTEEEFGQEKLTMHEDTQDSGTEEGSERKPLIAIVEDDADLAEYLQTVLQRRYRTVLFHNGKKAFDELPALMPDLLICDVMLPGMNGIDLTHRLKSNNEISPIPVIILTARTGDEHMVEGLSQGADVYLTKPFNISILEAQVSSMLKSRQTFRARFSKQMVLEPTEEAITPMDERFLTKLMEVTEQKLSDTSFDVSYLIDEMHMSHSIILKKVKALTGLSLVEFIRTMRIKKAAQIFKQDKLSVSEVGFMVGFSDPKYFSKCFTKEMGVKPTEFIRQHHDLQG